MPFWMSSFNTPHYPRSEHPKHTSYHYKMVALEDVCSLIFFSPTSRKGTGIQNLASKLVNRKWRVVPNLTITWGFVFFHKFFPIDTITSHIGHQSSLCAQQLLKRKGLSSFPKIGNALLVSRLNRRIRTVDISI